MTDGKKVPSLKGTTSEGNAIRVSPSNDLELCMAIVKARSQKQTTSMLWLICKTVLRRLESRIVMVSVLRFRGTVLAKNPSADGT